MLQFSLFCVPGRHFTRDTGEERHAGFEVNVSTLFTDGAFRNPTVVESAVHIN